MEVMKVMKVKKVLAKLSASMATGPLCIPIFLASSLPF
jgi:hypothetical protein